MELGNFEHNVKSIRKEYEAYVLSIGEYDERVFLGDDADEDIGTPAKNVPTSTGNLFYFFSAFILRGYLRTLPQRRSSYFIFRKK